MVELEVVRVEKLQEVRGHDGLTEAQIDAALLRLDADVQQRLVIFDGGPELMSWETAHRLHRDEPYIGCPFCQDRFVSRARSQGLEEALRQIRGAATEALVTLEGYLLGEAGLPFTEPYGTARKAANYLRAALGLPDEEGEGAKFKYAGHSGPHPTLAVACPTCGSPVGHYCNDESGSPVDGPHHERRVAAGTSGDGPAPPPRGAPSLSREQWKLLANSIPLRCWGAQNEVDEIRGVIRAWLAPDEEGEGHA